MDELFADSYIQADLQRWQMRHRDDHDSSGATAISPTSMLAIPQSMNGVMALDAPGITQADTYSSLMAVDKEAMGRGYSVSQLDAQTQGRMQFEATVADTPMGETGMMEFGGLNDYHFGMEAGENGVAVDNLRRGSMEGMGMGMGIGSRGNYGMASALGIGGQIGYEGALENGNHMTSGGTPLQGHHMMASDGHGAYDNISQEMVHGIMGYGDLTMHSIGNDRVCMDMFNPNQYSQQRYPSTGMEGLQGDFIMPYHAQILSQRNGVPGNEMGRMYTPMQKPNTTINSTSRPPEPIATDQPCRPATTNPDSSKIPSYKPHSNSGCLSVGPGGLLIPKPEPPDRYKDIYSSSNFDMVRALANVMDRKSPEINLGKVDLSCAFVVCDLEAADCPIIYASDIFERLTGYSTHEVLGQNCRFLQAPDGKVQAGVRQPGFADSESVYYLKQRIDQHKEAQRSIINYRKGGQPFLNLLTMIPIPWDDPDNMRYVVGFQIDLVVKPEGVKKITASGNYTINYSQGEIPKYTPWIPPILAPAPAGKTVSRDEASMLLQSYNTETGSESTKKLWAKMLLEETDDVIHVLSLKGLFLYISPSSQKVLEYEPKDLIGTALSAICHPSDIVPVTRELKDTIVGRPVNVVFRIRRRNSGYTWFESHGCLNVEQGKGRKCIILVGREKPVYSLTRQNIEAAGGSSENEFWSKLSTSGMFLFASSNVRTLLDRQSEDLLGTSFQSLLRTESKLLIGRTLEKVRTGQQITVSHEIFNRRGLMLQARTTFHPGDARAGQKPTFIIAQTRLLKPPSLRSLSSSSSAPIPPTPVQRSSTNSSTKSAPISPAAPQSISPITPLITSAGHTSLPLGSPTSLLSPPANLFTELQTTRTSSWQFELRHMEKTNRLLAEELILLLSNKKKRKRRKAKGGDERRCGNCGKGETPEWRRGPSGGRELCNGCGLRWAKIVGRGGGSGGLRELGALGGRIAEGGVMGSLMSGVGGMRGMVGSDSSTSRS